MWSRYEVPKDESWYYQFCRDDGDVVRPFDGNSEFSIGQRCEDVFNRNEDGQSYHFKPEEEFAFPGARGFKSWIEDEFEDAHDEAEERKNSVIFNAFIFMQVRPPLPKSRNDVTAAAGQVFNEINARKIYNEYNILDNITSSPTFCLIFVGITGLQVSPGGGG